MFVIICMINLLLILKIALFVFLIVLVLSLKVIENRILKLHGYSTSFFNNPQEFFNFLKIVRKKKGFTRFKLIILILINLVSIFGIFYLVFSFTPIC